MTLPTTTTHLSDDGGRVGHELLAADQEELASREVVEPALHVAVVLGAAQRVVCPVHLQTAKAHACVTLAVFPVDNLHVTCQNKYTLTQRKGRAPPSRDIVTPD